MHSTEEHNLHSAEEEKLTISDRPYYPQLRSKSVTLIFKGLMVGHYDHTNCASDHRKCTYEVGILPAPGHNFNICIEEEGLLSISKSSINLFEYNFDTPNIWRLEVSAPPGGRPYSPDPARLYTKGSVYRPTHPLPGSGNVGLDFAWLLDLESQPFSGHLDPRTKKLPLIEGVLKPIIHIPTGHFYSLMPRNSSSPKHKLNIKTGNGAYSEFGFMSDVMVADFNVIEGQEIILKAGEKKIFSLHMEKDKKFVITFDNTPVGQSHDHTDLNQPSHFQLYYLAFNVPGPRRCELRPQAMGSRSQPDSTSDIHHSNEGFDEDAGASKTNIVNTGPRGGAPSPYKCGVGHLSLRKEPLD